MASETPWLDYTGQTTPEILACKDTHRIDSLLCALESGLLLRQSTKGKRGTTAAERTFLAIMALDQEVNNGGYDQFFLNSSREHASRIVRALQETGCEATAELTAKAIAALGVEGPLTTKAVGEAIHRRDPGRTRKLNRYDRRFYKLLEIEPRLFAFAETRSEDFRLEQVDVPPPPKRRGSTNVTKIKTNLEFRPNGDNSYEAVRALALEVAPRVVPEATEREIEGAIQLYLFQWSLYKTDDYAACEHHASAALDLAWEDSLQSVYHQIWVKKLLAAGRAEQADAEALKHLRRLAVDEDIDSGSDDIINHVTFWALYVEEHADVLPEASALVKAVFPEDRYPRRHTLIINTARARSS